MYFCMVLYVTFCMHVVLLFNKLHGLTGGLCCGCMHVSLHGVACYFYMLCYLFRAAWFNNESLLIVIFILSLFGRTIF